MCLRIWTKKSMADCSDNIERCFEKSFGDFMENGLESMGMDQWNTIHSISI